jgi:hypothetical protein
MRGMDGELPFGLDFSFGIGVAGRCADEMEGRPARRAGESGPRIGPNSMRPSCCWSPSLGDNEGPS